MTQQLNTSHDMPRVGAETSAAAGSALTARTVGVGALVGAAIAVAVDLLILAVGNIGAPVEVVTGWSPDGAPLTVGEVFGTVAVAIAFGGLLLWLLSRRWSNVLYGWSILAACIAVASAVPLWRLDVATDSKVALSTMHLVTGAIAIASQRWATRR